MSSRTKINYGDDEPVEKINLHFTRKNVKREMVFMYRYRNNKVSIRKPSLKGKEKETH